MVASTGSMSRAPSTSALASSMKNALGGSAYPRLARSVTLSRRATNRNPARNVSMAMRLATRWNFTSIPSDCNSCQAG
jgi:hypothetical protein